MVFSIGKFSAFVLIVPLPLYCITKQTKMYCDLREVVRNSEIFLGMDLVDFGCDKT